MKDTLKQGALMQLADVLPKMFGTSPTKSVKQVKEVVPVTDFSTLCPTLPTRSDQIDGTSSVYVVNYEYNEGFAIVSTDTRLPEVFCYSDQGNITDTLSNPGLKLLLEMLPATVKREISKGERQWSESLAVQPRLGSFMTNILVPVKWGQYAPFNDFAPICPSYNDHMPAGCVATAIAQICTAHKNFSRIPYYQNPTTLPPLTQTPSGYVDMDWDALIAHPKSSDFEYYSVDHSIRFSAAALFSWIQSGVWMEFDCDGSSSNLDKAKFFLGIHYSRDLYIVGYNLSDIMTEILENRPVYIRGVSPAGIGHAWVIDGWYKYEIFDGTPTKYYVHCNWGWDGTADGFYYDGMFDVSDCPFPDTRGIGTNYTDLKMIINIKPR